ncbi:hypothetical protein JWR98_28710, partial [Pseudomonas sp. MAFF 301380]|nr:hypothetical protein [Pseudomonas lactucae]
QNGVTPRPHQRPPRSRNTCADDHANYSNELKQQIRELGHTLMHKPVRPMKLKTAMSHLLHRP